MNTTERVPRAVALRAAIASTRLEGRSLHPQDLEILEAWARHELNLAQTLEQLRKLLGEASTTLSPDQRRSRARAAFPTLREAELHCYGFETQPVPTRQEQHDQIGERMLASARRLATDPEHLAKIKKLLF
jgi:histone acetyltransferase (RNA polymerase elongator complex component)